MSNAVSSNHQNWLGPWGEAYRPPPHGTAKTARTPKRFLRVTQMVQVRVTTRDAYTLPTTHPHSHCRRLRKGGREIVELGLLLRREPAEDANYQPRHHFHVSTWYQAALFAANHSLHIFEGKKHRIEAHSS